MHADGDTHTTYRTKVAAAIDDIAVRNGLSPNGPQLQGAARTTALKAAAADVSGLQQYLRENLSPKKDLFGTIRSAKIDLKTGEGVPTSLAEIEGTSAFKSGKKAFTSAIDLDGDRLGKLYEPAKKFTSKIYAFSKQVTTLTGKTSSILTEFGKKLGILGLAITAANLALTAYDEGSDAFLEELAEEGTNIAIGAAASVVALGVVWMFPVARPSFGRRCVRRRSCWHWICALRAGNSNLRNFFGTRRWRRR